MGCATIVSNVASMPEVCQDAALYINPYNVHDIACALCRLIEEDELALQLAEKGRKHIRFFHWEKTREAHREIIKRLLV